MIKISKLEKFGKIKSVAFYSGFAGEMKILIEQPNRSMNL